MSSKQQSPSLFTISPEAILPSITAGFIIGLIEIILAVSFAALIFSGELTPFVLNGIGFGLLGATLSSIVIGLYSSIRGTVGGNQDAPAAILAIAAGTIAQSMAARATGQAIFSTVVMTITLTAFLTGLTFIALGYFKLGRLVRFLPYPVIGGFLAGTGWLLIPGAIGLMTDTTQITALLTPAMLMRWVPGLLLALVLFIAPRFSSHYFVLPGVIISAGGVFHLAAWLLGTPITVLSDQGWLLGPFPEQSLFQPFILWQLEGIEWLMIARQLPNILTIVLTSTFALLLNASGVGLAVKEESDLDRDLQAAGVGNVLSGFFAGFVGYQQLSLSVLNHRLKADNRLPGLVVALLCSLTLFFGASILSVVPKLVVGGLLLYLGIDFLYDWVYRSWFTFPKIDYAIILLILVIIATVGFLQGVIVGILAATILFVINYSRINIIRHVLNGAVYHSRVMRPLLHQQLLEQRGEQLHILELQGFIFFGTAQQLIEHVQNRINDQTKTPLRYLLIDFRFVTGIDSSVTLSFDKLKQITEDEQITVILTDLDKTTALKQEQILADTQWLHFQDLEQGVTWYENQLIEHLTKVGLNARPLTFVEQLAKSLSAASSAETQWAENLLPSSQSAPSPQITKLMGYLQQLEINSGETILHHGEPVTGLYFIEDGQLTAQTEQNGRLVIWRILEKGAVVGEIGWYTGWEASTDVVATQPSTLLYLSTDNIKQMETEAPELAIAIHRLIVTGLSEKLTQTNQLVQAFKG